MKPWKTVLMVLLVSGIAFTLAFAGDVEKGKMLFNDPKLGGGTSGKSCGSCHPNGENIDGTKKTFTIMKEKQNSPEEAVNFCIKMALKGTPIDKDSQDMKDLVSYIQTLKGTKKKKAAIGC